MFIEEVAPGRLLELLTSCVKRDFAHIRSHSFRGKRFEIVWRKPNADSDGKCDPPDSADKRIHIGSRLSEFDLLETVIHEADHANHWDLSEEAIEEGAHDTARLLWRMGFRLVEGDK